MQDDLFGAPPAPPPAPPPARPKTPAAAPEPVDDDWASAQPKRRRSTEVRPLPPDDATRALAARLNPRVRLGASTWSYPG